MARIFDLVAPSGGNETESAKARDKRAQVVEVLKSIRESGYAAEPAPSRTAAERPAKDPVPGDLDPADVKANGSATDSVPDEQFDEPQRDADLEGQSKEGQSVGGRPREQSATGSVPADRAVDATTGDEAVAEPNETYAGILAAVFEEAQQKAEVALAALIEPVRIQQAQQDAAEMASAMAAAEAHRVEAVAKALDAAKAESARALEESERRHAEESRQAREQVDADMTAAIDRVRSEEAERLATEVARVQKELEARRVDDLERARRAVVESFSTLTGSVEDGAQA